MQHLRHHAAVAVAAVCIGAVMCGTSGVAAAAKVATATRPGKTTSLAGIPASSQKVKVTVSGGKVKIPLGGGKTARLAKGAKLKIAFFAIGSATSWMQAQNKAVLQEAAALGASATKFTPGDTAHTQYQQVQTALTSKKYNAIIVDPADGSLECKLFTSSAPAKGIPVIVLTNPLCKQTTDNGIKAWSAGTAAFVGGNDLEGYNQAYFVHIAKENPHATVGFLTGPLLNGATITTTAALKAAEKTSPNFHVVATYNTTFTSAKGLSDTQEMLQAHPNVNTIISIYAGITPGAVSALKAADKAGKVKLYGEGGNTTDVQYIKQGTLTQTIPLYPTSTGLTAVKALYNMAKGRVVPRYLGNDGAPPSPLQKGPVLFLTKKNVGKYTPQF